MDEVTHRFIGLDGVGAEDAYRRVLEAVEISRRDRQPVLIDEAERLIEPVGRALKDARALRVIVTSRRPVGIETELLVLDPLSVPAASSRSASDSGASEAVELFVSIATHVVPGFQLDQSTADPVRRICRAVEGLPLAIRLAAGRLSILGLHELAQRLDDSLDAIATGDGLDLEASVAASVDLLSSPARNLLSLIARLPAPWSVDTVEALTDRPILDALAEVAQLHLVTSENIAGRKWFSLPRTVRQHVLADLPAPAWSREALFEHVRTAPLEVLSSDLIRSALEEMVSADDARAVEVAARFAAKVELSGRTEGLLLLDAVRDGCASEQDRDRIDLCILKAQIAARELVGARSTDARIPSSAEHGPFGPEIRATRAALLILEGRPADAVPILEGVIDEFPQGTVSRAACAGNLATALHEAGQGDEAMRRYAETEQAYRVLGARHWVARAMMNRATLLDESGQPAAAIAVYDEVLPIARQERAVRLEALVLLNSGNSLVALDRFDEARVRYAEAFDVGSALRWREVQAAVLTGLAEVSVRQGSHARSAWFVGAAEALGQDPDAELLARLVEGLGEPAAREHRDSGRATSLERVQETLSEAEGAPLTGSRAGILRRLGQGWEIRLDSHGVIVTGRKGLEDIARLIGQPGRPIHVRDLAGSGRERARANSERLRKSVSNRIRSAIHAVGEASPAIGAHLRTSIRTGVTCVYDPETPVTWSLETPA